MTDNYEQYDNTNKELLSLAPRHVYPTRYTIREGVETIGQEVFTNSWYTEIIIPDSVKIIKKKAFYNSKIFSCTLPPLVSSIFEQTFYDCKDLVRINIPSTVTYIGKYAFAYCHHLKTVTFDTRLAQELPLEELHQELHQELQIDDYAFFGCLDLKSIIFPEGLTSIGMYAFYLCSNLESAIFPKSLGNI